MVLQALKTFFKYSVAHSAWMVDLGMKENRIRLSDWRYDIMTANQIEYAKHLETKRHNVVSEGVEAEKARAQTSQAAAATFTANESARHNKEAERINWFSAQTDAVYKDRAGRAQLATAAANQMQASAAIRNAELRDAELNLGYAQYQLQHDIGKAQLAVSQKDAGTRRISALSSMFQGLSTVAENRRHNLASEKISGVSAQASKQQADVVAKQSDSQIFRNYAGGFRDITTGISSLFDVGSKVADRTDLMQRRSSR